MNLIFDMSCIMCNWLITDGYRCVFCALGKIEIIHGICLETLFLEEKPHKKTLYF